MPIDVPETEYTVEFRFRTEDPNAGLFCVVDANLGGGGHDRHLHLTGGNIRVSTYSGPGVEVSEGLNLADGNNKIDDTLVVILVEQEGGPVETPIVTLAEGDGVLIIDTTGGTLQSAPSVIGPWKNVDAPLQLNLNELDAAGFFRAVVE